MREININARLIDGTPRLGCIDDNATIGAMWDTGAQNLAFTRDTDLAGYDMMLHFNTGGEWLEVNVGKANSYTITNALTQSGVLGLRVSFWESSTFRYGSVNTLSFKYKESPQNSSIPEDEISQYLAILGEVSNIKTQIDAVNDGLSKRAIQTYTDISQYGGTAWDFLTIFTEMPNNSELRLSFINTSSLYTVNALPVANGIFQLIKTSSGRMLIELYPAVAAGLNTNYYYIGSCEYTTGTVSWKKIYYNDSDVQGATTRSGYVDMGGGLKMCWGTAAITPIAADTPTEEAITFPITFKYTPVVFANARTSGPGTVVTGVTAGSESTTGFSIYLTRINTISTGVTWFAVGM